MSTCIICGMPLDRKTGITYTSTILQITSRPPPNPEYHLSPVLVPRMNRYIGISREGTVCISWPSNIDDPSDFELTRWHKKFMGIYLLLSLHAHGERVSILSS